MMADNSGGIGVMGVLVGGRIVGVVGTGLLFATGTIGSNSSTVTLELPKVTVRYLRIVAVAFGSMRRAYQRSLCPLRLPESIELMQDTRLSLIRKLRPLPGQMKVVRF